MKTFADFLKWLKDNKLLEKTTTKVKEVAYLNAAIIGIALISKTGANDYIADIQSGIAGRAQKIADILHLSAVAEGTAYILGKVGGLSDKETAYYVKNAKKYTSPETYKMDRVDVEIFELATYVAARTYSKTGDPHSALAAFVIAEAYGTWYRNKQEAKGKTVSAGELAYRFNKNVPVLGDLAVLLKVNEYQNGGFEDDDDDDGPFQYKINDIIEEFENKDNQFKDGIKVAINNDSLDASFLESDLTNVSLSNIKDSFEDDGYSGNFGDENLEYYSFEKSFNDTYLAPAY